jgi:ATP-dependent Lon protease
MKFIYIKKVKLMITRRSNRKVKISLTDTPIISKLDDPPSSEEYSDDFEEISDHHADDEQSTGSDECEHSEELDESEVDEEADDEGVGDSDDAVVDEEDLDDEEDEDEEQDSNDVDEDDEDGNEEKLDESEEEEDSEPKKKSKKPKKNDKKKSKKLKSIQIQIVSNRDKSKEKSKKKKQETESEDSSTSESEEESSSEEEDNIEEEYLEWVPKRIRKDARALHKVKGWIVDIEDKTITIDKLLKCKIRSKYKAEIFEWIMIYENSMPLSEERKILRKQIFNLMETYKKEYCDYKIHKKEIKAFEKKAKDFNELHDIQYQILKLTTDESNKEAIYRKYMELMDKAEDMNDEFYKLKSWIQLSLQLPFDKVKAFPTYLSVSDYLVNVKAIFDQELYGMEKVKEQLLLFIHGKLVNPEMRGCCLGLVGDPGVGKTSIARCLAKVMDFPFEQIIFGGVNSAEFIRGFDYTYVGSRPGEIVRCLTRMQYKNGILFFDEYEKISQNKDVTACLLHITDFTQNNTFRDNYLHDLKIDLSSLWFIYSMNALPEDEALKDRIFCIKVDGYKEVEKVRILVDYLLPKHLKNLVIDIENITIDDTVATYFIRKVCPNEKGIRTMEKHLKDLLAKISFLVTNQQTIKCSFLLPSKYFPLQYPVKITEQIVDVLLKDALPNNLAHLTMYC